ncbi:hypothetical protein ABGT15_10280 [Flavobacterium enshiense]|uniref:hypothetical protein n=1 Tax=Flavobacterium enshiense TaxID=1341165 RepID=UPI00345E00EB
MNLALSLLPLVFLGVSEAVLLFLSFGFGISLLLKEVKNKEDYLFYYNNGFSKVQLWLYAGIVNVLTAFFFLCVYVFFLSTL